MTRKNTLQNDQSFVTRFFSSALTCYLVPLFLSGANLIYSILSGKIVPVHGYYLIHYMYTYERGFVARGLVGEIISWFVDTVTDTFTQNLMIALNILLMLAFSLCIGKAISSVRHDEKRLLTVLAICFVFYVLAMPLDFYYKDFKLDKILWMLTLLSVYLTTTRFGIWAVPIICIIATLINPVFLFCSMILIAIIMLQEFHFSSYSVKNGFLCGFSYISMILIGAVAPSSEKLLGFETPRELVNFYFSRYENPLDENVIRAFEEEWLMDYFLDSFFDAFKIAYEAYFIGWNAGEKTIVMTIIVAIPIVVLMTCFWRKIIKAEENKFQKFIFFLCAVAPAVIIPPVIASWEFPKYFYNYMLVQSGLVIYFTVKKIPSVCDTIEKIKAYMKEHLFVTLVSAFYFLIYIAMFCDSY